MNPTWLFAASRRLPSSLVVLALLAVVGAALGPARIPLGAESAYDVPWVAMIPVLMAGVVAASTTSPFADLDASRARSLAPARLVHLGALVGTAAVSTWAMARPLPPPFTSAATLRNLALLCGLGLLATCVARGRFAWMAPAAYGIAALLVGSGAGRVRPWAWLLMPDHSGPAALGAGMLFVAGVAVATLLPGSGPAHGHGWRQVLRR